MGTLINGIKEIFASASQTSPTNIPTCAADGTPNGNITIANLASVLGEYYNHTGMVQDASDDLSTIKTPGVYWIRLFDSTGCPNINGGMLFVMGWQGYKSQLLIGNFNGTERNPCAYFRTTGAWDDTYGSWAEITHEMPTFYKDYSTLASLASALGVCKREISPNSTIEIANSSRSMLLGCIIEMNDARSVVFTSDYHEVSIIQDYSQQASKYGFTKGSGLPLYIENKSSGEAHLIYMIVNY